MCFIEHANENIRSGVARNLGLKGHQLCNFKFCK